MESIQLYKTADGRTFNNKSLALSYEIMRELVTEVSTDAGIEETNEMLRTVAIFVSKFDTYVSRLSEAATSLATSPDITIEQVMKEFRPVLVVSAQLQEPTVVHVHPTTVPMVPEVSIQPSTSVEIQGLEKPKSVMTFLDDAAAGSHKPKSTHYRPKTIYDPIPNIDPKTGMVNGTKSIATILNDPGCGGEATFFDNGLRYVLPDVGPVTTNILEMDSFRSIQGQLINQVNQAAQKK